MSQTKSFNKISAKPRFLLLLSAAVALWVAIPFLTQLGTATAHADGGMLPALTAQLTGEPIGGATPHGFSYYFANASATPNAVKLLNVSVSNINLPDGTVLQVSLNTAAIGTITLDNDAANSMEGGHGSLRLSTLSGDTVPDVVAGDTLTVGPGATAGSSSYLTGTFAPPPSPSPTSSHTPFPTPSHTPFPTPSHTPFPTPSHTPFPTPSHTPFPTPSHTASPSPTGTPGPARVFAARLNGANEVPPVTTDGLGYGFVCLNSAETQIRVNVGFRNLSGPATAITINGPASTTENGPVIFTFTSAPANSHPFISQTFDVTADQVAQLRAGMWYIQVATAANTGGEIRGQLNALMHQGGGGHNGGGVSDNGPDDSGLGERYTTNNQNIMLGGDYDDYPYSGDFDGDGITDMVMFYPSIGSWYISLSSNAATVIYQYERQQHPFTTVIDQ